MAVMAKTENVIRIYMHHTCANKCVGGWVSFCFNVPPTAKVIWGGGTAYRLEELGIILRTSGNKASGLSTTQDGSYEISVHKSSTGKKCKLNICIRQQQTNSYCIWNDLMPFVLKPSDDTLELIAEVNSVITTK